MTDKKRNRETLRTPYSLTLTLGFHFPPLLLLLLLLRLLLLVPPKSTLTLGSTLENRVIEVIVVVGWGGVEWWQVLVNRVSIFLDEKVWCCRVVFSRKARKLAGLALRGGLGVVVRYKNDPEILAMTNLVSAYQRNEIMEFEKILKVGRRGGFIIVFEASLLELF